MKTGSLQCCKLMACAESERQAFLLTSLPPDFPYHNSITGLNILLINFILFFQLKSTLFSLLKLSGAQMFFLHHCFQGAEIAKIFLCCMICFNYYR